jgi:two-component system, sensor histidine kinase and response regulator
MSNKPETIFIIDDNLRNIQVAANVLRDEGFKVLFSDQGSEGIKNIEKYQPDLILLDIMMPLIDGFEVCTRLKSKDTTQDIPVIFLTAKTEIESITHGLALGGVDYVTKPFNANELLARIKTHLTLRRQQKELEMTNITKDKLFSVLGHDLRGNLASIITLSGLLLDPAYEKTEGQLKEFYGYIQNQANTLNIILTNVLDWSKSRDNKLSFDPHNIEIDKISENNIKLLGSNANLKQISMQSVVKPGVGAYADENMVNTVMRNLLFNAIKFTNLGGSIHIDAWKEAQRVVVKVEDTGVGIRKEKQPTIFSGETVAPTRGTNQETGTGLGLSICKEFVLKNGGEIWIESETGKGTKVFFSLPLQKK